jgi:hypothetical protein
MSDSLTIALRRLIPALILAGTACGAWSSSTAGAPCVASATAGHFKIDCPNPTLERLAAALRQTGRVTFTYPDKLGGMPLLVAADRGPLKDILASALSAFDYAFILGVQGQTTSVSEVIIVGLGCNAPMAADAPQPRELPSMPKPPPPSAGSSSQRPIPSQDQTGGPIPPPPSAVSSSQMPIPTQDQTGGPIPLGSTALPIPGVMIPGPTR